MKPKSCSAASTSSPNGTSRILPASQTIPTNRRTHTDGKKRSLSISCTRATDGLKKLGRGQLAWSLPSDFANTSYSKRENENVPASGVLPRDAHLHAAVPGPTRSGAVRFDRIG